MSRRPPRARRSAPDIRENPKRDWLACGVLEQGVEGEMGLGERRSATSTTADADCLDAELAAAAELSVLAAGDVIAARSSRTTATRGESVGDGRLFEPGTPVSELLRGT